jgi:hypothetical protein
MMLKDGVMMILMLQLLTAAEVMMMMMMTTTTMTTLSTIGTMTTVHDEVWKITIAPPHSHRSSRQRRLVLVRMLWWSYSD